MVDRQPILAKVKKLLALAERGGTPEEAANAAAKAQAILTRYNLDRAALDEEPFEEAIGVGEPLESLRRMPSWRVELGSAVARANGCRILVTREPERQPNGWPRMTTRVDIIGRPSEVEAAHTFYAHLRREIERLLRESPFRPTGTPFVRTWANAFRRGAVDTIDRRLQEALRQEAEAARTRHAGNPNALARIDDHQRQSDRVHDWMKERWRLGNLPRSEVTDLEGWCAGREAGYDVDLAPTRSTGGRLAG